MCIFNITMILFRQKSCIVGLAIIGCLFGLLTGCVDPFLSTNAYAVFGPVTSFGLSPEQGEVVLLSEQVIYAQEEHRLTMEYQVKLDSTASFLLPNTGGQPTITVDGVEIVYKTGEHPTAYIDQPMSTSGDDDALLRQSVHFYPNYVDHCRQPDDSYSLLLDSLDAEEAALTLKDTFWVYDVSAASDVPGSPSFEVTGNSRGLRLLFVDGQCTIDAVDKNYDDAGVGTTSFSLDIPEANRAATKKWFAVLKSDAGGLTVTVNGQAIPGQPMLLSEILSENPGTPNEKQEAFLANLNRHLAGALLDGSAMIVNSATGNPFDRIASGGKHMVELCRFVIEDPGEHTITITMDVVVGTDGQLLFTSAPDALWASVGERTLARAFKPEPNF